MGLFDTIIVQPIFNILMVIYGIIPDFGVSVIIFTILVRFLMWPLVKKQLHQAKAMRKLQPELTKLNAKFKNDRQAKGLAMLELYKKHNISPFGSIGLLIVQIPIIIGIYRVVQIFVSHGNELGKYAYGIIEAMPNVGQLLADPARLNQNFLGVIDLTQQAVGKHGVVWSLFVLAIIAAVMQYLTSRQLSPTSDNKKRLRDIMSEAASGKEADQSEINAVVMRKMMKVMPIMLFFIMINLPGALALYMAVANVVAYSQNAIILRGDQQEMEAIASKAAPNKARAKKRADAASEAKITRIKAKG